MGLNSLMRLSQHVAFQAVRVECHLTFVLNKTLKAKKNNVPQLQRDLSFA